MPPLHRAIPVLRRLGERIGCILEAGSVSSRQVRAQTVACKDEFKVAERSGDSADGRNRDRPAKTLAMPLSNSSKGDFGDGKKTCESMCDPSKVSLVGFWNRVR